MKKMNFTYESYADLIKEVRIQGYNLANYHNCEEIKHPCILRHDVDMDIKKALKFAEFEYSINVQSTYFFLCSSKFYNLLEKETREAVRTIYSLGHDIGLHFDETAYPMANDQDFVSAVGLELDIMRRVLREREQILCQDHHSRLLGIPISSVSMHRPSKEALVKDYDFSRYGAVNSYAAQFFKKYKYLSDSRMNWRENPFNAVISGNHEALHILTHPFWYSEKEEDTRTTLLRFIRDARMDRYEAVKDNFRDLQEFVQAKDLI